MRPFLMNMDSNVDQSRFTPTIHIARDEQR